MRSLLGLFSVLFFSTLALADSTFPLRTGTRWTLQHHQQVQTTIIEGLTTIRTSAGPLYAAVMRRGDGTDRLVFRSDSEWIECESLTQDRQTATCSQPMTSFKWPLNAGDQWHSGGYDFHVIAKERISVPFKENTDAWHITYTPSGGSDPLGEVWIVEGIGRVRIREGSVDFVLAEYEAGTGKELSVSDSKAISAFLMNPMSQKPSFLKSVPVAKTFLALSSSKFFPLVLFQLLVITLVLALGYGLWKTMKNQKGLIRDMELRTDPKEESKFLAMFVQGGDLTQVETRLEQMVLEHPSYPDLRHQLAFVQKANGKLEEAKSNWRKAIELNPNYVEARLGLAHLLLAYGDAGEAAEHFQAVVKKNPSFVDAQVGLGKSLMRSEKIQEAEKAFTKALEINPSLGEAKNLLSECRKMSRKSRGESA